MPKAIYTKLGTHLTYNLATHTVGVSIPREGVILDNLGHIGKRHGSGRHSITMTTVALTTS